MTQRAAAVTIVAALTVLAAVLRFPGIDFGLPDRFRPDEEYVVSRGLGFTNDWNPHFAIYPAAHMYVLHGVLRANAALKGEPGDFRTAYAFDGGASAHYVGRLLSVAFGAATIPVIYLAAATGFGRVAGIAAAAILTAATIHVRESKYATVDAATIFWLTMAIWWMLRVIVRGKVLDSLLAGALVGYATANKYPAGAALAGLATAHLGARWREGRSLWRIIRDIRPYVAVYAAAVAFFLGTPYLFLDWKQTTEDFQFQRGFLERGVGNELSGYGWPWLLFKALPDGLGPELAIFLLIGMAWALVRPRPGTITLFAIILTACIGMTASHYVFYRYILIPLPCMILLAAIAISDLLELLRARLGARPAIALVSVGLTLVLVPSLIRDYKLNRILARRDTRSLAREWIEKNIPPSSRIAATDASTPYGKPQLLSGYQLVPLEDLETLRRKGVRWILSDSSPLAFYSRGPTPAELIAIEREAKLRFDVDPVKPDTPIPVFDHADAFYVPLRHASSMKRPGPRIRIWELPSATG